jgi:hypothetical protein
LRRSLASLTGVEAFVSYDEVERSPAPQPWG